MPNWETKVKREIEGIRRELSILDEISVNSTGKSRTIKRGYKIEAIN